MVASRQRTVRALACLLVAAAVWFAGNAAAHATLVIGTLSFSPDPAAGASELVASVVLEDPGLVEVEDAVVFLELRHLDGPGSAPAANSQPASAPVFVSERLPEVTPGTYAIEVPAPEPGTYLLSVRDRTYRQEEAVANLVVTVAAGAAIGEHPFVLPPTATGPASLGTWLVWLIGVPLLAGVLVTVLVLRGGRGDDEGEPAVEGDTQA